MLPSPSRSTGIAEASLKAGKPPPFLKPPLPSPTCERIGECEVAEVRSVWPTVGLAAVGPVDDGVEAALLRDVGESATAAIRRGGRFGCDANAEKERESEPGESGREAEVAAVHRVLR